MNSLNHYAYGSVADWVYRYVAGLQPLTPGFRNVRIAPTPIWDLRELAFVCLTSAGEYRISWKCEDAARLTVCVEVPFGTCAELVLPDVTPEAFSDRSNPMFANVRDQVCYLSAGQYSVTYATAVPLHTCLTCKNTLRELLADPKARGMLIKVMPQITQVPESMKDISLAAIMNRFGRGEAMEQFDGMLAKL